MTTDNTTITLKANTSSDVSVYYNSACPVCRVGINSQKEKSTACAIEWVDVHEQQQRVVEVDESLDYVRERLHVVDGDGHIHMGVNAFAVLWKNSPKERWKATLITLPIINTLAQWGYKVFARGLFTWNRWCKRW